MFGLLGVLGIGIVVAGFILKHDFGSAQTIDQNQIDKKAGMIKKSTEERALREFNPEYNKLAVDLVLGKRYHAYSYIY